MSDSIGIQLDRDIFRGALDIETDNKEAEAQRLIALGAKPVGKVKSWHVLEAPSGHRFCLIGPTRAGFLEKANAWD